MEKIENGELLDAGMISSAQAVEHYEICRDDTLIQWAKDLGNGESAGLLQETLDQEKNAERLLSRIARASANRSGSFKAGSCILGVRMSCTQTTGCTMLAHSQIA